MQLHPTMPSLDILAAIATDPGVDPAFAAVVRLPTSEQLRADLHSYTFNDAERARATGLRFIIDDEDRDITDATVRGR